LGQHVIQRSGTKYPLVTQLRRLATTFGAEQLEI